MAYPKSRFDDYIRRFNERDDTAFEDYLSPTMHMLNGNLEYDGIQGMKDHYAVIWAGFTEQLHVERFVSSDDTIAIRMWTHFISEKDDPDSLFGAVEKGTTFDFHGLIMYHLDENQLFESIQVAYNSFTRTDLDGTQTNLGIVH